MGRVVALLLPGVGYAIVPLILLAIYESELVEVWGGLTSLGLIALAGTSLIVITIVCMIDMTRLVPLSGCVAGA